jgi:hypothetical protein
MRSLQGIILTLPRGKEHGFGYFENGDHSARRSDPEFAPAEPLTPPQGCANAGRRTEPAEGSIVRKES